MEVELELGELREGDGGDGVPDPFIPSPAWMGARDEALLPGAEELDDPTVDLEGGFGEILWSRVIQSKEEEKLSRVLPRAHRGGPEGEAAIHNRVEGNGCEGGVLDIHIKRPDAPGLKTDAVAGLFHPAFNLTPRGGPCGPLRDSHHLPIDREMGGDFSVGLECGVRSNRKTGLTDDGEEIGSEP